MREEKRLLTLKELRAMPRPQWVIEGVLPHNAVSMVYGNAETGKSFVVLDAALAVASHKPWHGRKTKGGAVLYVIAEGIDGFAPRIEAWEQCYGPLPDDVALYPYAHPVNLFSPTEVQSLIESVQAEQVQPVLVVIDTLGRCMDGADENSNSNMNLVIGAAETIWRGTGAAVLLVHHAGNKGSGPRGASALRGGVAMYARVQSSAAPKARGLQNGDTVTLTCEKMKDAVRFDPVVLNVEERTLSDGERTSLVLVGGTEPVEEQRQPRQRRQAQQAKPKRRRATRAEVLNAIVEQPGITPAQIGKLLGFGRNAAQKHVGRLLGDGEIWSDEDGRYYPQGWQADAA